MRNKGKSRTLSVDRIQEGKKEKIEDEIVEEKALSIYLNDQKITTLFSTPADQKFLALGFLFTEGFLKEKKEVKKIVLDQKKSQVTVLTWTKKKISSALRKNEILTSGCGRGKTFQDLEKINPVEDLMFDFNLVWDSSNISKLIQEFEKRSSLFHKTGGIHSAALATKDKIALFNEDVGRHNAVDKILGESLWKRIPLKDKVLVLSGRISSDIVVKGWRSGIFIIISRTAPTTLAIELAQKLGITLVGFARGSRMNVYTCPVRINPAKTN